MILNLKILLLSSDINTNYMDMIAGVTRLLNTHKKVYRGHEPSICQPVTNLEAFEKIE
jgi:hypothetical protein